MDLQKKPLYSLRDLASRLGVKAPTACTKTELIAKIEERKTEIEENKAKPIHFTLGRPRLNNSYIEVKTEENGKITFYESKPQEKNYDATKEIIKIILPPAIEDEESRKKLKKAKEILDTLSFAITTVLER